MQGAQKDAGETRTRLAVNRMSCEDCGTVFYSAAAKTLVERGEACAKCGGKLQMAAEPPSKRVATAPPGNGDAA
jgi:rRNA maturation endonuclease Nob1